MELVYYVYIHLTSKGIPFYVGKGYKRRAFDTANRNVDWWAVVNKHRGFIVKYVKINLTCNEALSLEVTTIAKLSKKYKLTNRTIGGQGAAGRIVTAETRAKIGAASKGNKNCVGRVLSDSTKRKIGAAHKGRKRKPFTDATRLKMSLATTGSKNPMFGKHVSAETRDKLSRAGLGRNHTEEYKARMSKRYWEKHASNS